MIDEIRDKFFSSVNEKPEVGMVQESLESGKDCSGSGFGMFRMLLHSLPHTQILVCCFDPNDSSKATAAYKHFEHEGLFFAWPFLKKINKYKITRVNLTLISNLSFFS